MKVGILTANRTNNFGTDLQAYAMLNLFQEHSDCEIIDYVCPKLENSHKVLPGISIKNIIRVPWRIYVNLTHRRFRKKHFRISGKKNYSNNIDLSMYDAVVVGSDQIWNLRITGYDLNFYLKGCPSNVKKYSYAASLGTAELTEWNNKYNLNAMLDDFETVSVREESGVHALDRIGIKAQVDLDPLLCVEDSLWRSLEKQNQRKKPYMLIYLVEQNVKAMKKAIEYAKTKNWDVVRICEFAKPVSGVKTRSFANVHDFLTLVDNAEMILTNSYHGASMAVSLNTDFCTVPLSNGSDNTRTRCLLERVCLSQCELTDLEESSYFDISIDWHAVNDKLNTLRKASRKYIELICKGSLEKNDVEKNTIDTK